MVRLFVRLRTCVVVLVVRGVVMVCEHVVCLRVVRAVCVCVCVFVLSYLCVPSMAQHST